MAKETGGTEQVESMPEAELQPGAFVMDRKQRRTVTIASALVICLAFTAMTVVRNNYDLWCPELFVIDLVVAMISSILASQVTGMEERAYDWASRYLTPNDGLAFRILRLLPVATCRAAIMTAFLSVVNATFIPMVIYRETIEMPVLAVPFRFLADIPQGILLCLAVLLAVEWKAKRAAK